MEKGIKVKRRGPGLDSINLLDGIRELNSNSGGGGV